MQNGAVCLGMPECLQRLLSAADMGFRVRRAFDEKVQKEVLDSLAPDYITGITLLGGEPFEPENQKELVPFMRKVAAQYPNKNVWAFTGYIYDKDLIAGGDGIPKIPMNCFL